MKEKQSRSQRERRSSRVRSQSAARGPGENLITCVCGRRTRLARQQRAAGVSEASTALCGTAARHSGKAAPVRRPLTACPALVIQPGVIPPISRPMTQLTCCLQGASSRRKRRRLFTNHDAAPVWSRRAVTSFSFSPPARNCFISRIFFLSR